MKNIYGLARPYNFNRAIPFLLSLLLLLLALLLGILLAATGRLTVGTFRWYFFIYVGITLILSAGNNSR